MDPAQTTAIEMAVDQPDLATNQATHQATNQVQAQDQAPPSTATINSQGLQASIHHRENNTNNTVVAGAKASAVEAARKLADLAVKTDPMAAYSALNELVTTLAYWTPLETTASCYEVTQYGHSETYSATKEDAR